MSSSPDQRLHWERVAEQWEDLCEDIRRHIFLGVTWDFQVSLPWDQHNRRMAFVVPDKDKIPKRLLRTINNAAAPPQLVLNIVTPQVLSEDFFPCLVPQDASRCSCQCCGTNKVVHWLQMKLPSSCHVISIVSECVLGTPVSSLSGYIFAGGLGISSLFLPDFPDVEVVPLTMDDILSAGTACFQTFAAVIVFVPEEAFPRATCRINEVCRGTTDFLVGAVHSVTNVRNKWFAGLGIRGTRVQASTAVSAVNDDSGCQSRRMLRRLKSRTYRRPVEFAFLAATSTGSPFFKYFTAAYPGVPVVGVHTTYCAAAATPDSYPDDGERRKLGGPTMKLFLLLASVAVAIAVSRSRTKRQAYELPDGVEFIVGSVRTSFQCQRGGYFADVDNNCQVFHICNEVFHADGSYEIKQYSFFCGNQTIFNQLSLTCAFPEESVPCSSAPDFFYINDNIGRENTPLHTEDDLARAAPLIPGFQQQQQPFAAAASERKDHRVPAGKA